MDPDTPRAPRCTPGRGTRAFVIGFAIVEAVLIFGALAYAELR
jgi:hypothetical protein